MYRKLLCIVAVLVLAVPHNGCTPASAETASNVRMGFTLSQSFDSLGVIVVWDAPAPPNARQYPVAQYNVRVIEYVVGDTLAQTTVPATVTLDTLWIAMPPLGDTLIVYAAVNTVDDHDQESEGWSLSGPLAWITTPMLPNEPGGVRIDTTIGALIIDSLRLITLANATRAADSSYLLTVGDTLRFGAVLYSGRLPVECCCPAFTDPLGTHPCDSVVLYSLNQLIPYRSSAVRYVRAAVFSVPTDGPSWIKTTIANDGYVVLTSYMRERRRAGDWGVN